MRVKSAPRSTDRDVRDLLVLLVAGDSLGTRSKHRLSIHDKTVTVMPTVEQDFDALCRVTRQNVAISYFNPASLTLLNCDISAALDGRKSEEYPASLAEVKKYFPEGSLRFAIDHARMPLIHTLRVAIFEPCSHPKE